MKIRVKNIFLIVLVLTVPLYVLSRLIISEEYEILKVIDGDTIVLNDDSQTHVRYIGIDTPEILTLESPGEPFSFEAKRLNENLLYGKKIRLDFDKEKYDHYGRMLAYVYAGEVFVNEEIVRRGLATSLKIKPNTKYINRIEAAENEAKKFRRGIWSDLSNFHTPQDNSQFQIKPMRSEDFIGRRVVVKAKISHFRKSNKVIVLRIDDDMDIVIFKGDWGNFNFFNIEPESYYVGQPVEVIGRVKLYKGRPQIIVNHPITLKKLL